MGVHQEFAGCLVRMGCNASHRTAGRYVCVSAAAVPEASHSSCCTTICFSLYFIVSPLMFFVFKLKRQLCIHAVMILNKNTHSQSLLLSTDLEKMFSPAEGFFYCFGKSAFECFITQWAALTFWIFALQKSILFLGFFFSCHHFNSASQKYDVGKILDVDTQRGAL